MERIYFGAEILPKDATGKPLRSKYLTAKQNLTPVPQNLDLPLLNKEIILKRDAYFKDPNIVDTLKYTKDELQALDYWCKASPFYPLDHIGLSEYMLSYDAILMTVKTCYMTRGSLTSYGRRVFSIACNGGQRQIQANVLVAWAFLGVPPSPSHDTVDHMDIDETNDCLYNLRWATRHQQSMNRRKSLKPRKGRSVIQQDSVTGAEIKIWPSMKEAAIGMNLKDREPIRSAVRFGRLAAGYRWIYNDKLLIDENGRLEEWRIIQYPDYGEIRVSSMGRVWSQYSGPWFGRTNQKGRKMLGIKLQSGKIIGIFVHTLVALAFIGPMPADKPTVDHIDGNPLNNRPENLRYLTVGDNNNHAFGTGNRVPIQRDFVGINALKPIVQLSLEGKFIEEYMNTLMAHECTGFREKGIKRAASGERPNANGFIWMYASQYFK